VGGVVFVGWVWGWVFFGVGLVGGLGFLTPPRLLCCFVCCFLVWFVWEPWCFFFFVVFVCCFLFFCFFLTPTFGSGPGSRSRRHAECGATIPARPLGQRAGIWRIRSGGIIGLAAGRWRAEVYKQDRRRAGPDGVAMITGRRRDQAEESAVRGLHRGGDAARSRVSFRDRDGNPDRADLERGHVFTDRI